MSSAGSSSTNEVFLDLDLRGTWPWNTGFLGTTIFANDVIILSIYVNDLIQSQSV